MAARHKDNSLLACVAPLFVVAGLAAPARAESPGTAASSPRAGGAGSATGQPLGGGPASADPDAPGLSRSTVGQRASDSPAGGAAERAGKLHEEAKELYVEGRYREALDKLEVAVALDPKGKDLHYVLAFVAEKLLDLDLALQHYRIAAALETNGSERERLAKVVSRVEGAQRNWVAGGARPKESATVSSSDAAVASADGPDALRISAYVAVSVSGASLLVGAIAGCYSLATDPGASAQAAGTDLQTQADRAHTAAVVADVGFVVGGLSGLLAAILAVADGSAPAQATAPAPRPAERSPGSAGPVWLRF